MRNGEDGDIMSRQYNPPDILINKYECITNITSELIEHIYIYLCIQHSVCLKQLNIAHRVQILRICYIKDNKIIQINIKAISMNE